MGETDKSDTTMPPTSSPGCVGLRPFLASPLVGEDAEVTVCALPRYEAGKCYQASTRTNAHCPNS